MKMLKYLLLVLFSMVSAHLWAQTDSVVQWKLVKPTKVFKLLGVYWQRNGNNFTANTGYVYYGNRMNFEFMQKLFDEKTVNTSIDNDKTHAIAENSYSSFTYFDYNTYNILQGSVKTQTSSGFGFNLSYDLITDKNTKWNKEVRIGGSYQRQYSNGYHRNFFFPLPDSSGKMFSCYFYQYNVQGILFNADFLLNKTIVKNSVAVYAGSRVLLFPEIFSNMNFYNTQYYRVRDTLFAPALGYIMNTSDSNILYPAERQSAFNLKYGFGATIGIKFNISCSTNLFLEYQRAMMWDAFLGFRTIPFQSSSVLIGIRKKLNFIKEEQPQEESLPPRPFY